MDALNDTVSLTLWRHTSISGFYRRSDVTIWGHVDIENHAFVSLYLDWRRSIGCVGMKVTIRVVMNEVHATIQINLILYFCNFSISFVSTCICRGTKLRCSLNDNKITKSRCLHSLSSTKFVFYFQRQREITTICYIAELKNKWMSPTTNNERITKRIIICKCQWSPLD